MADTNYFYSIEKTGYTQVSDLFRDVYEDMIRGGAFKIVNLSNSLDRVNEYVDTTMSALKFTVTNGGALTHTVGQKLYVPGTPAQYITGIPKPQPYVVVTKVVSALGVVSSTNAAAGKVYEVSDVINGDIGTTATDWPLFNPAVTGTVTLNTNSTGTPSDVIGTMATTTTPDIFSFTVEAGEKVDPLNTAARVANDIGAGQNDDAKNKQPWRVQFIIPDPQQAQGSVAAPLQMFYNNIADRVSIAKVTDDAGTVVDNVGSFGAWQPAGVLNVSDPKQGFINRKTRVADQERTYPLSYILTISTHGFFLGVWEGNWSTQRAGVTAKSNYFNWVVCQRPVDRNNGRPLVIGKSPVFSVNGADYIYYKSIVREADVLHPSNGPSPISGSGKLAVSGASPYKVTGFQDVASELYTSFLTEFEPGTTIYNSTGVLIGMVKTVFDDKQAFLTGLPDDAGPGNSPKSSLDIATNAAGASFRYLPPNQTPYRTYADRHSTHNHMLFSSTSQVALTEDKTYLITFPHNLTTPRFRYTEELDVMGTTSSDVVRTGQDIQFTTYNEWGPRTYRALPSSSRENTGVRIAVLRAPTGPAWIGLQTVDGDPDGDPSDGNAPRPTVDAITQEPLAFGVPAVGRDDGTLWPSTWIGIDPFPGFVIGQTDTTEAANLSVLTDNTINSLADFVLTAGRPWSPLYLRAHKIVKIRTTDFGHLDNIRYEITRGRAELNAIGLDIDVATGQIDFVKGDDGEPLYTYIQAMGYAEDTIVNFTVTIFNDSQDGETPPGRNNKDFYFLYKI